jgi:PilZ domain
MSERRRAPRSRESGWGARVRPGHRVHVVNVSAGGALIDATRPLRPGTDVEVQFERSDSRVRVSATVLRCGIAALDPHRGPTYRAAIAFSQTIDWVREGTTHDGYCMPDVHDDSPRNRSKHVR